MSSLAAAPRHDLVAAVEDLAHRADITLGLGQVAAGGLDGGVAQPSGDAVYGHAFAGQAGGVVGAQRVGGGGPGGREPRRRESSGRRWRPKRCQRGRGRHERCAPRRRRWVSGKPAIWVGETNRLGRCRVSLGWHWCARSCHWSPSGRQGDSSFWRWRYTSLPHRSSGRSPPSCGPRTHTSPWTARACMESSPRPSRRPQALATTTPARRALPEQLALELRQRTEEVGHERPSGPARTRATPRSRARVSKPAASGTIETMNSDTASGYAQRPSPHVAPDRLINEPTRTPRQAPDRPGVAQSG